MKLTTSPRQETRQHGRAFAASAAIAAFALSAGLAACSKSDDPPVPMESLPPGTASAHNPNSTAEGISNTAPGAAEKPVSPPDTNSQSGMTPQQESQSMPAPGQNNDHSSTDKGTAPTH